MANATIIAQRSDVMVDTTMTQYKYDVIVDTTTNQNNYDVVVDLTMKQTSYDVMVDITMKQTNYDVMVDTTMKQTNYDVNDQAMPYQTSSYVTAVSMTAEKGNSDFTADEYNCNVTDETTMTKRDSDDVTVTLNQSSRLQGAAMVALVTLCFGCANCAINPFVFWFQIHKYRSACLEYLPCSAANTSNCSCYRVRSISRSAIDMICGMDVDRLPPRLSFRTRRQIHPDAAYKCTDENEDAPT